MRRLLSITVSVISYNALAATNLRLVTSYYGPLAQVTFRDEDGGNWMLLTYFRLALETRVLFEALMLHMACLIPPGEMGLRPEYYEDLLLRRRGGVMQGLRSRLLDCGSRIDDTTILTVTTLMVSDVRGDKHCQVSMADN
jgi:hypothetical protein